MATTYKRSVGSTVDLGRVEKIVDGVSVMGIPKDDRNRDYQEYKAWLDAGNTPEAAD